MTTTDRPTNRPRKRPTNQPTATAFGYVSGWHAGPTPQRCSGAATMPNGSVVACTHPSHDEPDPEPVPAVSARAQPVHEPVHETSPAVIAGALDPRDGVVTPTGRALPYAAPQSPLWYEQRRGGITATDLPKLLGVTDYGGPLHVWADKRGELPDDGVGEAGRWGTLLEDVVAAEWATREQVQVHALGVLEHVDRPWQRASLDRLVVGCEHAELCALEVKTRSAFVGGRWREQIPDDVYVQCAWQRIVSGLPHVHVAVLIGGQRLLTHRYDPDPGVEAQCLQAAGTAWQHVLDGVPPVVEPDDLLLDLLDRLNADRTGDVEVPGDLRAVATELVDERRRALAAAAQAKADADRAKAGLVQLLGDGEVALADGVELFRYRPATKRQTAWRDVVKAAPPAWRDDLQQLVAAHTTTTTSRSLILPDLPKTETPESTDAAA